ncbi:blood vessel epicardial substance isoform X1 [Anopheles bellator]|uniref:blood vessel epicardial substance isoform X1 n=1 Tax=Anopheles bellator TaxID=139047 RepID=UPI002647EF7D|nr:blood vessel epicardial substance isoform X1 [Anopheles bellator]XP_058064013.1 blood vessel epicardial substance isoform X1 [Anopheles bellator]XP_058064014.1 blood vessel epicardial substance isoform X1 [Anopheles bellator]XP_058064015.1 blood vessel epicardial substance isoform X1 [Anopheles bellator]
MPAVSAPSGSGDGTVPYASSSISASHGRGSPERIDERNDSDRPQNDTHVQQRYIHNSNDTTFRLLLTSAQKKSGADGRDGASGTTAVRDADNWLWVQFAWSWPDCFSLGLREHLYYQLGHGLFLLAFLAPSTACGALWLRCAALAGCILMGLWGWLVACSLDAVGWFGLFLGVNAVYAVALLLKLRPVKFEKEIESVYVALFKPLRVSRHQFKKVLNCMKIVRALKFQEIYVQEKVTKVDSLSLVLSGKLVVSQNQKALHIVFPHQFLDSPEWFGVSTDDFFQVSIMAMEESRVLIWHRDKLKLSIMAEPFLQTVFDHILSRDVVKKLIQVTQVSETMAQSNDCISSGDGDDSEDKPMLVIKSKMSDNGGHGITALINRQLQDEHFPLLSTAPRNPLLTIDMQKLHVPPGGHICSTWRCDEALHSAEPLQRLMGRGSEAL